MWNISRLTGVAMRSYLRYRNRGLQIGRRGVISYVTYGMHTKIHES